tara:strand:+ start:1499 stop:1723 length:225 start_codon:yes stop_codon:yes gene_type:complete
MMGNSNKRKRKYFKPLEANSLSTVGNKIFLVRFQDIDTGAIQSQGPFSKEERAIETLKSYLKDGVCSWLVTYNE